MNDTLTVKQTATEDAETGTIMVHLACYGYDEGLIVETAGSAKCMAEDDYDRQLGDALALGRAMQKCGKALEKAAFDEVHYRDQLKTKELEDKRLAKTKAAMARYQWECEFAELINAKLAEESTLVENDVLPEPVLKAKKKARKKAHQIREHLPA